MPEAKIVGVEMPNLRRFLSAVSAADRQVRSEMYRGIVRAARPVVERASQLAPVRTGRLAAGYYARARGAQGEIVNRMPYAAGAEWGLHGKWKGFTKYPAFGTGAPAGRGRFAWRAVLEKRQEVQEAITAEMQRVIELMGWAERVA